MREINKDLCKRTTTVRAYYELSQKEFADALGGVTIKNRISDIERFRTEPTQKVLAAMVLKLNVDAHWLLTGQGEMIQTPPPDPDEECKKKQGELVDTELIEKIVEVVGRIQKSRNKELSPKGMAKTVRILYEYCMLEDTDEISEEKVAKVLSFKSVA